MQENATHKQVSKDIQSPETHEAARTLLYRIQPYLSVSMARLVGRQDFKNVGWK